MAALPGNAPCRTWDLRWAKLSRGCIASCQEHCRRLVAHDYPPTRPSPTERSRPESEIDRPGVPTVWDGTIPGVLSTAGHCILTTGHGRNQVVSHSVTTVDLDDRGAGEQIGTTVLGRAPSQRRLGKTDEDTEASEG